MPIPNNYPVSRFPGGLTNIAPNKNLSGFGMLDPTVWFVWFEDFNYYISSNYTATTVGTTPAQALSTLSDMGQLTTTLTTDNPSSMFSQKNSSGFTPTDGKRAFYKSRFKTSEIGATDVINGMYVADTTPLDNTDGIYFLKSTGAATVDIICSKDASTGKNTASAIATLVADTFITLGWYFDGVNRVYYYVNDVLKGSLDASSTYLPNTLCLPSFGMKTTTGVADVLTTDYQFFAVER